MIYLLVSVAIFNLIAYFMPKRMTKLEMYTTSLFSAFFQVMVDVYLDLKYDLYGYFEKGVQFRTSFVIFGIFPAVNIIILNYFPFHDDVKRKGIYILAWTVFLLFYEWGSVKSGYFYYNGWKLWYSALCYPTILTILAWQLAWLRRTIDSQYVLKSKKDR